jgi:hypothetical protein
MHTRPLRQLALVGAALLTAALTVVTPAAADPQPAGPQRPGTANYGSFQPAGCNVATPSKGQTSYARCYAEGLTTKDGRLAQQQDDPLPGSLGPADIRSAYGLRDSGAGRTVAIVDAFGYTSAESDLAVFRAHYGLPPCPSDTGCFTKVDQNGGTNYPAEDPDWSIETALDLDAVSSACPACKILLVEADNNSSPSLGRAVDTAASLGAVAISNSYGAAGEIPFESYYDHYYDHPGVAVTVSTGDYGNVQSYPATNPNVVAVGGTTLTRDSSTRGWHESAWDSGGSGCSLYEPRPDYQQGVDTGCPDNRATADVAADADPASGLAVYNTLGQDGWAQWGGTSLASPLVAAMYALAGPAVPGTYPVSYLYRSGAALNDVTEGSDGFCGTLVCNAGPGYDGPTGLGTPAGVSALTLGDYGRISGALTDAKRHKALAGATVALTDSTGYTYRAVTDAKGRYNLAAAAGTYHVVASKFGFGEQARDGVTIRAGGTLAANYSLAVLSTRTVSGTVTDGSGQGWPVYAKITIDGDPNGAVYTDPYTGRYSVDLPTGANYALHVAPVDMPGYTTATAHVALSTRDVRQDVRLTVDASSCTAAGYAYAYHGGGTGFEGWSAAQDGWSVTDDAGTGKTWVFDDPGGKGNLTGGTGSFAIVDDWVNPTTNDTSLVSPALDLSAQTAPVIGFDTYYYDYGFGDQDGDIYLSLDGGSTWSDVWHAPDAFVTGHVEVPIPQAAGHSDVRIKFRFAGSYDNYWELDNVFAGTRTCDATPGGLVSGLVRDGNTGGVVDGATVAGGSTPAVTADGFYWLFAPQGVTSLTASARNYADNRAPVDVVSHGVVRHDWRLAAGHLSVRPGSISARARRGDTRYATMRLTNDGTEPLHLNLVEQNRGFTAAGGHHSSAGAPLRRVKVHATPGPLRTAGRASTAAPTQPAAAPTGSAWTSIADYPVPVMDNVVAGNDGVVYSVAGVTDNGLTAAGYAYHPDRRSWTRIADLPQALEAPVGAFVDGTLYVAGGWDADGNPTSATYAYDPARNTWATVADLPAPEAVGSATSVDGQLYVVAGCATFECTPASSATFRYDPDTNAWTKLADYPQDVVFLACAPAGHGVVCAGGLTPLASYPYEEVTAAAYQYVAGTDAWTRVADMPYAAWGMAYTGEGGRLQVVGGIVDGAVTNQASQFDPTTGAWSALPNAVNALYRGGAACGLYRVGGSLPSISGLYPAPYAEQLPGYDDCVTGSDVAWLSTSNSQLDLPPGRTVTVTVALDAPASAALGEYDARLAVTTDTPYGVSPVPVALTVRR